MRPERGVVLPTAALLASLCAVAIAAVGFLVSSAPSGGPPAHILDASRATATVASTPTPTPTPTPTRTPKPHRAPPVVDRGATNVEVFNNSNVHGLAARTATRAQQAGWNVVGTDNWYGTVDAPTVYYPKKLEAAARELGADLGIRRVRPAIAPMHLDRLTVILTAAYQP